jgi:hypothetical protein
MRVLLLSAICLASSAVAHTVPALNMTAYLGRWFQVYSDLIVEATFENASYCDTADYGLNTNGTISVLNRERQYGPQGPERVINGWAALDWYRGYNHSFLSQPWIDRKFDHAFICPNNIVGGQRSHRLRLLSELGKRECINQNLISFPATCPYEQKPVEELFRTHALHFPRNVSLPLIIDHDRNHANISHRIDFWKHAMRCFCHVVTETVYDDKRIHLTEKIFKPIVLQQPFLLVGNRGALCYLRDYGFQTFGNIWVEGYDDLDHEQRVGAVADICQEITSWSKSRQKQAQIEIADVVRHNHDWFYGGFQDMLWKETSEMINRWQ